MTTTNAMRLGEVLASKEMSLCCPRCHEPRASIQVKLQSPTDFACVECGEDFTADDVEEMVLQAAERWTKALAWLTTMPNLDD